MRSHMMLVVVLLCAGCTLLPDEVPTATPCRTQAVVFDVDGTLTPDVQSIFRVRPNAAEAVSLFSDKGYKIVYLTARIKFLQVRIPAWLEKNGFPEGSLHVTETSEDRKDHVRFKERILREFIAQGWTIVFAYGDSSSDFEAYAAVGIPKEHVFALKREGDQECQTGEWGMCLGGWTEHIEYIENAVAPAGVTLGSDLFFHHFPKGEASNHWKYRPTTSLARRRSLDFH